MLEIQKNIIDQQHQMDEDAYILITFFHNRDHDQWCNELGISH